MQITNNLSGLMVTDKEKLFVYNQFDLYNFIKTEIYPSNFEPGCDKYKLGTIHKEWSDLVLLHKLLLVLAPRDHLKSFMFTEAHTIQKLKYMPGIRIYIISKTDEQAKERINNIKKIIESSESLRWLKPAMTDDWSKQSIKCTNGATVKAAGFWSGLRGKHPHLMILDDPIEEEVIYSPDVNQKTVDRFLQTILPMAEPETQIIVVGTRQCEGDLYDNLQPPQWAIKEYRAILNEQTKETLFPEKWPWDALMTRMATIVNSPKGGMRIWLKEYMNDVTAIKGNIVRYEHFKFRLKKGETKPATGRWKDHIWDTLPDRLDIYQGWDLSVGKKITDDATGAVTIGIDRKNGNIYVLDVFCERLRMPGRLAAIKDKGELFPDVLQIGIENNIFQDDTVQQAIKENSLPIVGMKSTANKISRLESACTLFVNGKVYVRPEHLVLIEEIVSFPTGAHDDVFDAFDIAVYMTRLKRRTQIINMVAESQMSPELKQLALTGKLPDGKYQEMVVQKTDKVFVIAGNEVEFDQNDRIKRGIVWLLGKTMQEAIKTVEIRKAGVQESNRSYDQLLGSQRSQGY